MKTALKLWLWLLFLVLLTPLGLIIPRYFKSGSAWGEWRLNNLSDIWKAPFANYGPTNLKYIISAFMGVVVIAALAWLIGKFIVKKDG